MADWVTLGIKLGIGAVRGAGNIVSGIREAEAQKSEAEYNLVQLNTQFDRLGETLKENQDQLSASLADTLQQNSQGIFSASVAQQNSLQSSAVSNTENQAIMYAQLASIQRQNLQSIGSAEQAVATSGFRDTGSGANAIEETRRVAEQTYDTSRRQVQLSAYESYMQAADAYFSGNVQIEAYREASRDAQANFDIQSSMLESQYNYDKAVLEGEIGYWEGVRDNSNYTFWDGLSDFFGGFSF